MGMAVKISLIHLRKFQQQYICAYMEQFWGKKPGTHKQIIVGGTYIGMIA